MSPELITFCCSHCAKEIKVAKHQKPLGKNLICSGCNNVITLTKALIKKPDKLLTFICPGCHRKCLVESQQQLFGKKMKCQDCHCVFTLDEKTLQKNTPRSLLKDKDLGEIPREFNDYTLIRLLGRGAMGKVFEVFDRKRNAAVAMKVMISELQGSERHSQRFLREAKATMNINHSNIVDVYDMGAVNDMYYFTMELVEGKTLEEVINQDLFSLQTQMYILVKAIHAVGTAHTQRIVHRDLKPANIMVDRNLEPKVMDFGLAKFLEDVHVLTNSGDVLGTLNYMAPEQAEGKIREIDHRTDLYALGIILYQILTKEIPLYEKTSIKQLWNISNKMPPAPHKINHKIPVPLSEVCLKAIAKKRHDRYQHAGEFMLAIQPLIGLLPGN